MIIAIGLDCVLADLIPPILEYHNANYQTNRSIEQITRYGFWHVWECTRGKALECASGRIEVLLINYPWNQVASLPEGIQRVNNWEEIVNEISKRNQLSHL